MIAETTQFRFPLASAKRGLADDAWRPGSRRSNESSCCVSGKQQEPWAQFTHTWHPARLQGVALGAGAAAAAAGPSEGSAANAIQAGSARSRKRPGSLGWGPRLQRWTLTPQTDRARDKEGPAPRAGMVRPGPWAAGSSWGLEQKRFSICFTSESKSPETASPCCVCYVNA